MSKLKINKKENDSRNLMNTRNPTSQRVRKFNRHFANLSLIAFHILQLPAFLGHST